METRKDDMEKRNDKSEPLLLPENGSDVSEEASWMVYLSTIIAVCGSYEFGTCVRFFYDTYYFGNKR
jgi:SP family facilitated glucose transporter-like MFS transporter 8